MKAFTETFGLTVHHGAISFGLMAVHGERWEEGRKAGTLNVHPVELPGVPPIGVPLHLNEKYAHKVRESTRAARERVIVGNFFTEAFDAYQAGDRDRAEELYRVEWAALMGESPWPVPNVIDLAKKVRAIQARTEKGRATITRRYLLAALWDGVLSHMGAYERTDFLRRFIPLMKDFERAVDRDISELGLDRSPGPFHLGLTLQKS